MSLEDQMSKELFHSRSSQNLPFPITERITTSELAETRKLAPFPTRILPCKLSSLKSGCYRLTYRPNRSLIAYRGTLRVNPEEEHIAVSGDLYRFT